MARTAKGGLSIDTLESELESLIHNSTYFSSVSEDLRKLVHQVFFVHAILEGQLGMRIIYKLFEEQIVKPPLLGCSPLHETFDLHPQTDIRL